MRTSLDSENAVMGDMVDLPNDPREGEYAHSIGIGKRMRSADAIA